MFTLIAIMDEKNEVNGELEDAELTNGEAVIEITIPDVETAQQWKHLRNMLKTIKEKREKIYIWNKIWMKDFKKNLWLNYQKFGS